MASANINGTSLEYREQGQGEPVVFVHGSASDYRTWENQLTHFCRDFRTIAYSRRYHWPNECIADGADYAMQEHVDDLRSLLSTLNAAPAHLVGHSYGAFVCLLLATQHPALIRSLSLAEPPVITLFVSNTPRPLEILKLLLTHPRTAAALISFGARGMAPAAKHAEKNEMEQAMRIFGKAVLGPAFFKRLSEQRWEQVLANSIRAEFLGSGFPSLSEDDIRRLQTPTLLLTSEQGPVIFRRLADHIEQLLPQCERVAIGNASHIMHEDNATAFNHALETFLDRHRQAD